jgi:23S rRNA (cytidine1920-2'-O)/16S rRNA (cytidine1409-2'-O)-methyltransferase
MERTNFRYTKLEDLNGPRPTFASIDVSFISLRIILPPLKEILDGQGHVVALIKPQFEAGREKVGKSGVVRDTDVHIEVLTTVLSFAEELGFRLKGLTFSPITGGEGNIEFLAYWISNDMYETIASPSAMKDLIAETVKESQKLHGK